MKTHLYVLLPLLLSLLAPGGAFGQTNQVYYQKTANGVTLSAGARLLPVTTVRADTVITNNGVAHTDPYSNQISFIFEHVDRSPVTTGLLSDYGVGYLNYNNYPGTTLHDSNYVDMARWRLLYTFLYSSRFNDAASLAPPKTVSARIAGYDTLQVTNLPVLYFNYQRIRASAVSGNLMRVQNGQLYDVAGRTQSPYEVRSLFAVSPSAGSFDTGNIPFIFRRELSYGNTGKTVSSIGVDCGDGQGLRTIAWNTVFYTSYATTGYKRLLFRFTYSDGTVMQSQARILVREVSDIAATYNPFLRPTFTVEGPRPLGADVTVALSRFNATGRLRRPLIVAEGYDPWRIFSPNAPDEDFEYEDFVRQLTRQNSVLHEQLDDVGQYDLVFVNYRFATADILRNARVLAGVIEEVNRRKAGTAGVQPNVVMGVSMGGLVARAALRTMEVENRPHDTRLYVSMDSPHRGANVPLGFQYLVRDMAGLVLPGQFTLARLQPEFTTLGETVEDLGNAVELLNEPASRQMLIEQAAGIGISPFFWRNNQPHRDFMAQYNTLGYPQGDPGRPIRSIAVSNGSECGLGQGFAPHAELLRIDDRVRALNASAFWEFMGGFIPFFGSYDAKLDLVVNALPDRQVQRIYYSRLRVIKKVAFVINVNVTVYTTFRNSETDMLAWDNSPGGVYDVNEFTGGEDLQTIIDNNSPIPLTLNNFQRTFSFVPTVSALDITTVNAAALTARYTGGSNPANPSRMANYVTQERTVVNGQTRTNSLHTQFTQRNGNWLFNELQGTPLASNCTVLCDGGGPTISGDDAVCPSAQYTTVAIPGARYIWTAGGSLRLTSQNGNQAVFNANGSGTGTVNVRIESDCGNFTPPARTVLVGVSYSSSDYPVSGPASASCNQEVYYSTNALPAATSYQWFWPSGWLYVSGQGTRYLTLKASGFAGSGQVGVRVATACDPGGSPATLNVSVTCSGYYALYPNPADSYVEIAPDQSLTDNQALDQDFEVVIYDNFAQEKLRTKTPKEAKEKKLKLDVTALPPGIYVVQIIYATSVEQKSLEIMR